MHRNVNEIAFSNKLIQFTFRNLIMRKILTQCYFICVGFNCMNLYVNLQRYFIGDGFNRTIITVGVGFTFGQKSKDPGGGLCILEGCLRELLWLEESYRERIRIVIIKRGMDDQTKSSKYVEIVIFNVVICRQKNMLQKKGKKYDQKKSAERDEICVQNDVLGGLKRANWKMAFSTSPDDLNSETKP